MKPNEAARSGVRLCKSIGICIVPDEDEEEEEGSVSDASAMANH